MEHVSAGYCHSALLEANDKDHYIQMLHETVSFTTDLGVESAISEFHVADPLDVVPPWMRTALDGIPVLEREGSATPSGALSLLQGCSRAEMLQRRSLEMQGGGKPQLLKERVVWAPLSRTLVEGVNPLALI